MCLLVKKKGITVYIHTVNSSYIVTLILQLINVFQSIQTLFMHIN